MRLVKQTHHRVHGEHGVFPFRFSVDSAISVARKYLPILLAISYRYIITVWANQWQSLAADRPV